MSLLALSANNEKLLSKLDSMQTVQLNGAPEGVAATVNSADIKNWFINENSQGLTLISATPQQPGLFGIGSDHAGLIDLKISLVDLPMPIREAAAEGKTKQVAKHYVPVRSYGFQAEKRQNGERHSNAKLAQAVGNSFLWKGDAVGSQEEVNRHRVAVSASGLLAAKGTKSINRNNRNNSQLGQNNGVGSFWQNGLAGGLEDDPTASDPSMDNGDIFAMIVAVMLSFSKLQTERAESLLGKINLAMARARNDQAMSNKVNGITADMYKPEDTRDLPQDVIDYLRSNHIPITTTDKDGKTEEMDIDAYLASIGKPDGKGLTKGQLGTIAGALDTDGNRESDFSSQQNIEAQRETQNSQVAMTMASTVLEVSKTISLSIIQHMG